MFTFYDRFVNPCSSCYVIGFDREKFLQSISCTVSLHRPDFHFSQPLTTELGFTTSYYVSINDLVIEQCAADIQALKLPVFVSWRSHHWLQPADNIYFLYTTYTGPRFARQLTGRIWEGATVTTVALQIAYYMGFQKAILIGVDHNFVTQGKPNTTVVSQGDDPNHFSPGYFGKGFRWQLPDLETSARGYSMARQAYEQDGRQVVDATIGGKLRVFPRVAYDTLF